MPGLRIGWLATRNVDLLRQCAVLKDYTTICSSAPSEFLARVRTRLRAWDRERGFDDGTVLRVVPARLLADGFTFEDADLGGTLRSALDGAQT